MAKWLITLGIILAALGLAWPLLAKLGLGSWSRGTGLLISST